MPEEIVVFQPEHLDGCAAVFAAAFSAPPWHEPWSEELARIRLTDLLAIPRAAGLVVIDTVSGLPVAFALGYAHQDAAGFGFRLAELCVHPDHQGHGLGARLMRALEEHVATLGATAISLTTEGDAIRFYTRRGYEPRPTWVAMVRTL